MNNFTVYYIYSSNNSDFNSAMDTHLKSQYLEYNFNYLAIFNTTDYW